MSRTRPFREQLVLWYKSHRGWAGYLAIFTFAFVLFAYYQYIPVYADPDSFYHAKMGVLLRDGQFSAAFTALPYTTLAHAFADQHFLYHLLLVPFVSVIDPLVGLKLATILFGASLALTFYWFLRRWGIPWAFVTTVVLLLVNPFTFRMNLAKAPSLSLTLLLLGIAAAFSYRPWVLGILSFSYVWFYGGFPLLVVSALLFAVVGAVHRRLTHRQDSNRFIGKIRGLLGRAFRHHRVRRLNLRLVIAVVIGTGAGLVFNPFFPSNVRFYFDQLVRIGILNYQHVIGVGGEWYPYKLVDLLANTVLASIPLVVALVLFFILIKKQSARSITLFFLWLFFFVMTLKSRRYVEYYVPFTLLFAAFSLRDSTRGFNWRASVRYVWNVMFKNMWARIGVVALITYVLVMIPTIVVRDLVSEHKDLNNGFRLDLFSKESAWIRDNGQLGAVVFHSDWDEFPILFYFNSESRYIAGLDPTFLYLQDKSRYRQWADVTLGKASGDIYAIVRGSFNADFVLIAHDHTAMEALIKADSRFRLAFSGPDADVYTVQ